MEEDERRRAGIARLAVVEAQPFELDETVVDLQDGQRLPAGGVLPWLAVTWPEARRHVLPLAALVLAACGGSAGPGPTARPTASPSGAAAAGYAVVVHDRGRAVGRFDLAALRRLPQVDVPSPKQAGKPVQRGPRVRAVLSQAGVKQFGQLRVTGSDSTQTLPAADVDDQLVLDFDKRETVKLAGAHLPVSRWVRDVSALDADP